MNQPTKRRNPFDIPKKTATVEELTLDTETTVVEAHQTPYYEEPVQQYRRETQPTSQRVGRSQSKQHYIPVEEVRREKYTSTMDVDLRRKIKIVCATRGIMFAQFVEDACKEKLKKEGMM